LFRSLEIPMPTWEIVLLMKPKFAVQMSMS